MEELSNTSAKLIILPLFIGYFDKPAFSTVILCG